MSLLLCIALAGAFFSAAGTIRAYQQFQQEHRRALAADVSTVGDWMTLPYISRTYNIPEACLARTLHVSDPILQRHATLDYIALNEKKPAAYLVRIVQNTILAYRKDHEVCVAPGPSSAAGYALSGQPGQTQLADQQEENRE